MKDWHVAVIGGAVVVGIGAVLVATGVYGDILRWVMSF
jgi:hypothetical protein